MYSSLVIETGLFIFYAFGAATTVPPPPPPSLDDEGGGRSIDIITTTTTSGNYYENATQWNKINNTRNLCPPCGSGGSRGQQREGCNTTTAVVIVDAADFTNFTTVAPIVGSNFQHVNTTSAVEECENGVASLTMDACGGCCVACILLANETCGGEDHRIGICQPGSICWPTITPQNGPLVNGSTAAICIELENLKCETPIQSKGCNLHVKGGCVCSTVTACRAVDFQYTDEEECRQDWQQFRAMWQEDCLKARCNVVFQPQCPADSLFVPAPPPEPPECCQEPGTCQCSTSACQSDNVLNTCAPGEELVLTKKATGDPGSCCDIYECHSSGGDECRSVVCPNIEIDHRKKNVQSDDGGAGKDDNDDCPPDSFRPLTIRGKDACCPVKDECRCRRGLCKPVYCEDGLQLVVRKRGAGVPGECCDEFECVQHQQETATGRRASTCEFDGKTFEVDDTWRPSPCIECECKDGVNLCRKLECPASTCTRLIIPEGECCPVCAGCTTEDGESRNVTDEWQQDDCTTCTCEANGQISCQKQLCKIECDHPIKVPGECCPKCDKPVVITLSQICPRIELCPLRCEYGLKRNDRGCFICECQTDADVVPDGGHYDPISTDKSSSQFPLVRRNCSLFDGGSCLKRCAHGYDHDRYGCPSCKCNRCPPFDHCYKHCLYGFQTNRYGCAICKCRETSLNLESVPPSGPTASVFEPGRYDPSSQLDLAACRSSMGGGREHGEWWFDGCRYCYCDNGMEYCSILSCPPVTCTDPVFEAGDCCPRCLGSSQEGLVQRLICHAPGSGRLYVEGEYWDLEHCIRCTCQVGHVLCHKKLCPPAPCRNPTVPRGECCPICENMKLPELEQSSNGTTYCYSSDTAALSYADGSIWKTSPCESCICRHGKAECYKHRCPLNGCVGRMLQLKHECCPLCTGHLENGACRFGDSIVYSVGEPWRDGPCRNCSCVGDGETLCTQVECPRCSNATPVDGQCCPQCEENDDVPFSRPDAGAGREGRVWPSVPSSTIGTRHPEIPGVANHNSQTNLVVLSCVAGVFALLLIIVLVICYYRKRARGRSHQSNDLFGFLRRNDKAGGARLTKFPGYDPSKSVPLVIDDRNNYSHEQMKMLLSTTTASTRCTSNGGGVIRNNDNDDDSTRSRTAQQLPNGNNNVVDHHHGCPYDERSSRAVKNGTLLYDYDIDSWDVEKL